MTAKLRERGLSHEFSDRLAESQLKAAVAFFDTALHAHQARGRSLDLAIDEAFEDLSQWAAQLAETHVASTNTAPL